jgi:hypothetical protein
MGPVWESAWLLLDYSPLPGSSNHPKGQKTEPSEGATDMKERILRSCTILVLGLAATQTIASAQETPGIEGLWFANVTPVDCQTVIAVGITFRALYMFIHDGSLTTEAAFFAPSPRRSSGLGAWRHAQGRAYTSTFWFFRYNADGSFLSTREVTSTIELNGDRFTTMDKVEEYDANNKLISSGCAKSTATRVQ